MPLPDRLRLPFEFDPLLLQRDLRTACSDDWIAHFVKQNYEGDWSVIPLRGTAGATHPVMRIFSNPTATEFEDAPVLATCPYFRTVLATFQCPVQAVRLMRLTAGSVIKEHDDNDLSYEDGTVRFHVPVVTNPDVVFEINRRRLIMPEGSAWYLRLSDPHRVANHGSEDRVHLVIDAAVNDWVGAMLEEAARVAA